MAFEFQSTPFFGVFECSGKLSLNEARTRYHADQKSGGFDAMPPALTAKSAPLESIVSALRDTGVIEAAEGKPIQVTLFHDSAFDDYTLSVALQTDERDEVIFVATVKGTIAKEEVTHA